MSAYKTIKCAFKDLDLLIKALEDLGFKPAVHKEAKIYAVT